MLVWQHITVSGVLVSWYQALIKDSSDKVTYFIDNNVKYPLVLAVIGGIFHLHNGLLINGWALFVGANFLKRKKHGNWFCQKEYINTSILQNKHQITEKDGVWLNCVIWCTVVSLGWVGLGTYKVDECKKHNVRIWVLLPIKFAHIMNLKLNINQLISRTSLYVLGINTDVSN